MSEFNDKYDPFLLSDMRKSADRILNTTNKKEKIVVVGDSDTDGVTGTTILYDFLKKEIGCNVDYYVLNRNKGYGLSDENVDNILKKKPNLIITVDCGVIHREALKKIKGKDIEVIITDHHKCINHRSEDVYAIINPKKKTDDNKYPFEGLAGVGVALKLIQALCSIKDLESTIYWNYMDLVALGTMADLNDIDIKGENQNFVKYGLMRMNNRVGIETLLENSQITGKEIFNNSFDLDIERLIKKNLFSKNISEDINFELKKEYIKRRIIPILNATGEIEEDAQICVQLLVTDNKKKAESIIAELNKNKDTCEKKKKSIFEEVKEQIELQELSEEDKAIVVSGEKWDRGVLGSVAHKVLKKYSKTVAAVFNIENGIAKGSIRSSNGFEVYRILESYKKKRLLSFGGHERACGITINNLEYVDIFRRNINAVVKCTEESVNKLEKFIKNKEVEEIKSSEITKYVSIGSKKNKVFLCKSMKISRIIGTTKDNKGLKLYMNIDNNSDIYAIGFDIGNMEAYIREGDYVDVAFKINAYKNNPQMRIQAIKISKKIIDKTKVMKRKSKEGLDNINKRVKVSTLEKVDISSSNKILTT